MLECDTSEMFIGLKISINHLSDIYPSEQIVVYANIIY